MGDYFGRDESQQCFSARGSKSRNKVAVGEPAAGSLPKSNSLRQKKDASLIGAGRGPISDFEKNPKRKSKIPSAAACN